MSVDLSLLLPLNNENRWSDLLATLLTADPGPARSLLGLPDGQLTVRREYTANRTDRPDMALLVDGELYAILEAKVLSGLGPGQLDRYAATSPDAKRHILTHLNVLPVDSHGSLGWETVTWEQLISAYVSSGDFWCATTARAWGEHVARVVPAVDQDTRWDDLPMGIAFSVAIRTRMAWLTAAVTPPPGVTVRLDSSAKGDSAILTMIAETSVPQHRVHCAVEEALDLLDWPNTVTESSTRPKGPYVAVRLEQYGISTSRDFNWHHLAALWPTMSTSGISWTTGTPRKKAEHDRAGIDVLVQAGVPKHLGRGFGEGQVRHSASCMFGPTFDISARSTLGEIARLLGDTALLVRDLAAVPATVTRSR